MSKRISKEKRAKSGRCYDCKELAEPYRTRCAKHLKVDGNEARKMREKYIKENRCPDCSRPIPEGLNTRCYCVSDRRETRTR